MITRVNVRPEVMKWAIRESQIEEYILIDKFPLLEDWIKELSNPTFKQLRDFCDFIKIPFGFIFLKTPPKEEQFKVEFRTLSSKLNYSYSHNLKTVILEMDYKKSWMSEVRKDEGHNKVKWNTILDSSQDTISIPEKLMKLLGLQDLWQTNKRNAYDCFNYLREKIEGLGILVMMSGIVGNDTNRTLSVSEFRAFALKDDYTPLIFINRNDTDNGLLFSIIHELLHILTSKEDDVFVGIEEHSGLEKRINEATADFLLSDDQLLREFDKGNEHYNEIKRISEKYKVSTMVTAIKAFRLGIIDEDLKDEIIEETKRFYNIHKKSREVKSKGGNFYPTTASRMSKSYYNTVINHVEGGKIPYTQAYRLLGLKAKTFDSFRDFVSGRLYG